MDVTYTWKAKKQDTHTNTHQPKNFEIIRFLRTLEKCHSFPVGKFDL